MAKKTPKIKNKKNHLIEVLNAVTLKTPCKYNKKDLSAYVLSLFLSEDRKLSKIVNEINKYQFVLTDELIFKYYVHTVPKGRRYIKFTKKTKESKDKDQQIKLLMERYNISKREASLSLIERKRK
ncbi:MAG: hypothetical protein KQ78_01475 [Candidatus Izimaplasma bacterium HR2]|nr:MAG: hypothetical protein KQ78_01475 [Candidatus Izimaplasma bacterium HR2]